MVKNDDVLNEEEDAQDDNFLEDMLTSILQFDIVQSTPITTVEFKAVDDDELVPEADLMLEDAEESFLQEAVEEEDTTESMSNSAENNFTSHDHFQSVSYGDIGDEIKAVSEPKCFVTIMQLKVLLGGKCRVQHCSKAITSIEDKMCGYCVKLVWFCEMGHRGVWYSGGFYAAGFAINYVIDGALLLAGGSITQFKRFCKFSNLGSSSTTSFYTNQRLYVSPTVDQEFNEERDRIIKEVQCRNLKVTICGDGRMDSPGFSASKGTYTLMDYESKKLLTIECGDKREVNLKSTQLEVHLVMKCMHWILEKLDGLVDEVCTDAHTSMLSLMSKWQMQICPNLIRFPKILSCYRKGLSTWLIVEVYNLAKIQKHADIVPWILSIRNNFWYCCKSCDGNELKLRLLWTRLLHHISGYHRYCTHEEITEQDRTKPYIRPDSSSMTKLREIMCDKKWLKSLEYYTQNRHTGGVPQSSFGILPKAHWF
ncbi:uncharacterized protein LOC135687568 [Rhopilema esculentum]|uniref:uncharacterized protein LOC135687568 n=1 Tax=Rhopilema esculentum TaxID=499914 RepID=UPI0031D91AD1